MFALLLQISQTSSHLNQKSEQLHWNFDGRQSLLDLPTTSDELSSMTLHSSNDIKRSEFALVCVSTLKSVIKLHVWYDQLSLMKTFEILQKVS